MPWPGVMSSRSTRSAKVPWPLARSCSTTCALLCPAANCLPITPVKITLVAQPRMIGPITLNTMPTVARATQTIRIQRSGDRWESSRRSDGPKFSDFSAAIGAPGNRETCDGWYFGRSGALFSTPSSSPGSSATRVSVRSLMPHTPRRWA